jgi:hypothetical protein
MAGGRLFTEEEHQDCLEFYQKLLSQEKSNIYEWTDTMYWKHKRIRVRGSYRECLQNISAFRKERGLPIISNLSSNLDHYNRNQLVRLAEKFWGLNKSNNED